MMFKDTKQLKKALEENGHQMLEVDEGLMCELCNKWAKHRNDGGHAWGDAVGSRCVNNTDITQQQDSATMKPSKKRSAKKCPTTSA